MEEVFNRLFANPRGALLLQGEEHQIIYSMMSDGRVMRYNKFPTGDSMYRVLAKDQCIEDAKAFGLNKKTNKIWNEEKERFDYKLVEI